VSTRSDAELPYVEADLFPADVAHASLRFEPGADPTNPRPFGIVLPDAARNAVPKRRRELAAGRYCVREALRALAPALADTAIGTGPQREPVFPSGIVGAITHSGGLACAAVALRTHMLGVGVDIEQWVSDDALAAMTDTVFVDGEANRVEAQTGWPSTRAATLVFSAKETLYKCLFPAVQRYFDFKDAEVVTAEARAGRFTIRLLASLTDELKRDDVFEGRFQAADRIVITTMVRRATT
jgi:enterobactin synthetase component D